MDNLKLTEKEIAALMDYSRKIEKLKNERYGMLIGLALGRTLDLSEYQFSEADLAFVKMEKKEPVRDEKL